MSSNGVTEDADMAECDGEKVVTMMDVLQEQQEFEEDANAVLGASDEKNCTFLKGYIKRQALYACLTCCSDAKTDPTKRAGVCLACSLNCHENHELIELYTKRNFRCDCGNPKFNGHPCQYTTNKLDLNEDNCYNQNFSGLYCTCHRPYPDPEAAFEDEMIQCIICEDWLHAAHLEATLPSEQYAEMICKDCMEKNEFLHDYSDIAVNNETAEVDITSVSKSEAPTADESAENNIPKINGALESTEFSNEKENNTVNDIEMTEKDKNIVESTTDSESKEAEDSKESTALDGNDENKMDMPVPDAANSIKEDTEKDNKEESNEKQYEPQEQKQSENDDIAETAPNASENNEPNIDSITNDIPEKDDETKNEENMEEAPQAEEKLETNLAQDSEEKRESNENSIIESIEKLESELGNVEQTDKFDEQTPLNDSTKNDENKTESKNEDSITTDATPDKVESELNVEEASKEDNAEIKTSDVDMNEEKDANTTTNNDLKSETTDNIQNGTTENDVSRLTDEVSNEIDGTTDTTKDSKRKYSTEESEEVAIKKPKLEEESSCLRPKGVKRIFKGATFWPSNFRQKLCTCGECISMYKDLSVMFLTDLEDTVTEYEALGKQRTDGSASSQYERGLEALSSLDRIQQINALTEYNKMRDKLLDFLKSFKDRKEVVKEEDIKAFFAGMKPKREPDGVYFCR
ncbi:putative E3 ubiquitin-protein ligase UBR7 [Ostrinia nubilalis]|uniref:putative E3 ubiquitin-protein ligase UBR7 n=1 Tax=Ostrinia nubilalis TaxID=29057 RepID=UPI003082323F